MLSKTFALPAWSFFTEISFIFLSIGLSLVNMTSHLQKLNKSCKTKTSRSLVFIKNEENPKHVFNNEKSNKQRKTQNKRLQREVAIPVTRLLQSIQNSNQCKFNGDIFIETSLSYGFAFSAMQFHINQ